MGRDYPELWILRHGQTLWNAQERLQGWLDSPLTELGERQARAQGAILDRALPGPVQVLASPAGRAWRTASIAVEGLRLPVQRETALREVGLGDWQGRAVAEIRKGIPDPDSRDPLLWKFTAPGGETLAQVEARVRGLLARLDAPAVLVTHGITSRVIRSLVLGRPVSELSRLPGGQGVVHHLKQGTARVLRADGPD